MKKYQVWAYYCCDCGFNEKKSIKRKSLCHCRCHARNRPGKPIVRRKKPASLRRHSISVKCVDTRA